uniref:Uncharacterized protein n=1 Tax=Oryza punctata TaxID=4537 RepID=A0A0E0LXL3_ORYPU
MDRLAHRLTESDSNIPSRGLKHSASAMRDERVMVAKGLLLIGGRMVGNECGVGVTDLVTESAVCRARIGSLYPRQNLLGTFSFNSRVLLVFFDVENL